MLMAFGYGLLFGVPCVAWIIGNSLDNAAQISLLVGMLTVGNLLILLSYAEARDRLHYDLALTWGPKNAFVVVLGVVALAQAFKLRAYSGVLAASIVVVTILLSF